VLARTHEQLFAVDQRIGLAKPLWCAYS
jgi:hypothetical protein